MQNSLADKRKVTLIVRLTLDGHGKFVNGEIIDLEGKQIGRFVQWPKMTSLLQDWVACQQRENASVEEPE